MPIRRIARAALASYFLNEAAKAFKNTQSQAEEAAPFVEFVSHESGKKVPNDPELVVKAQGALMGGAGAALALGKFPRLSAALLTPTVGANAYMHDAFWAEKDPAARARKQSNFFRTVDMIVSRRDVTRDARGVLSLPTASWLLGPWTNDCVRGVRISQLDGRWPSWSSFSGSVP